MVFTHTMTWRSTNGTRKGYIVTTADHFLIYPLEPKSLEQFCSEPFDCDKHQWLPCTQLAGCDHPEHVFGDWKEDSKDIADIRLRWILSCIVNVFVADSTLTPSTRMLLNDLYTWIVCDKPCLQELTHHHYRAWLLLTMLRQQEEDVRLRMDEVICFLEDVLQESVSDISCFCVKHNTL